MLIQVKTWDWWAVSPPARIQPVWSQRRHEGKCQTWAVNTNPSKSQPWIYAREGVPEIAFPKESQSPVQKGGFSNPNLIYNYKYTANQSATYHFYWCFCIDIIAAIVCFCLAHGGYACRIASIYILLFVRSTMMVWFAFSVPPATVILDERKRLQTALSSILPGMNVLYGATILATPGATEGSWSILKWVHAVLG